MPNKCLISIRALAYIVPRSYGEVVKDTNSNFVHTVNYKCNKCENCKVISLYFFHLPSIRLRGEPYLWQYQYSPVLYYPARQGYTRLRSAREESVKFKK